MTEKTCAIIPPAGLFVFGSAPTAAINGIAVAIPPPDAAHYASGMQFAAQNLAKLVVPSVGGLVIDRIGLLAGFDAVLLLTSGKSARARRRRSFTKMATPRSFARTI